MNTLIPSINFFLRYFIQIGFFVFDIIVDPSIVPVEIINEKVANNIALPQIVGYNTDCKTNVIIEEAVPTSDAGDSVPMVVMQYDSQTIGSEDMRSALQDMVGQHIFWGKGAVKKMEISNIQTWNSYHCRWETFMESRKTSWKCRPGTNLMIDGPENGTPPQPWDIRISPPTMFEDDKIKTVVPHTEYMQQCVECFGRGRIKCTECDGRGKMRCYKCDGTGVIRYDDRNESCYICNGSGRKNCGRCDGDGMNKCNMCEGSGRIVKYIQLTVKFNNHIEDTVIDLSGIPADVLVDADGSTMCQQVGYRVLPPSDIFDPIIQRECNLLFEKSVALVHQGHERLLQERVTVRIIPVAKATGSWKKKSSEFWVHGNNKVAYAPNYLKEFYHGCSII